MTPRAFRPLSGATAGGGNRTPNDLMNAPARLETLKILVRPSPGVNGHEVCLSSEKGDLIARFEDVRMGVDPDGLLVDPSPLRAGSSPSTATIGRCRCGSTDCGSLAVTITREADAVTWTTAADPFGVRFDAAQYDAEVERAISDVSWETPDRTAARLIRTSIDHEALRRHGVQFSWASGRITERAMTIVLECTAEPYQLLVDVAWQDDPPESIAQRCLEVLAGPPSCWRDVRWLPQDYDLFDAPSIAGPSWKPG